MSRRVSRAGGRRLLTIAAAIAVVMAATGSQAASAASPGADAAATVSGKKVTRTVRALKKRYPLRSVLFGVWVNGRRLATGALGESRPGVRATKADHFRPGNVTEGFLATLLLRLVDQGRVRLDDPVSKWYPAAPNADKVTLGMLATMTSGYQDFVTTEQFVKTFYANPFRQWKASELLDIAFGRPAVFPPGTSWKFSDTNFVLLGELLSRITRRPLARLLREQIHKKLGLRGTAMRIDAHMPKPVLHGYTTERGRYEDTTRWSPSWVMNAATQYTTLGDMGRWVRALGTGSLLSRRSHRLQVKPQPSGLGRLPDDRYYGMGTGSSKGWIFNSPHVPGYAGVVSYLPSKKIAIVVFATQGRKANPALSYSNAIYNRIGKLLAPDKPPFLAVCTRPPC